MRIAVLGEFTNTGLAGSYARAFRALGHEVVCLEEQKTLKTTRVPRLFSWAISGRLGWPAERLSTRIVTDGLLARVPSNERFDVLLALPGKAVSLRFYREMRARTGCKVVVFHPDDPFNTNASSSSARLVRAIPDADLYLVWSRELLEKVRRAGARRAELLAFGADAELHHPVVLTDDDRKRFSSRICFLGNWDRERERWLEGIAGPELTVWGNDWDRVRSPLLKRSWRGAAVLGEDSLKILCAAAVNLNVLRTQNKSGHNMRTFEVPMTGAFMLTERSPDTSLYFDEQSEVPAFSDVAELKAKLARYLDDEPARLACAEAARRRALGHTYLERAQQVLEWLR